MKCITGQSLNLWLTLLAYPVSIIIFSLMKGYFEPVEAMSFYWNEIGGQIAALM